MNKVLFNPSNGGQVALIQKAFNLIQIAGVNPDGRFGGHTEARTRDFQYTNPGMTVDGKVGDATRRKMAEALRSGFVIKDLVPHLTRRGITVEQFAQAIIDGKSCDTVDALDYRFF